MQSETICQFLQRLEKTEERFASLGTESLKPDSDKLQRMVTELETQYIGAVVNLGSPKGGTHWVAILIDRDPFEIEYYDSVGDPPTPEAEKLLTMMQQQLNGIDKRWLKGKEYVIRSSDERHQEEWTACGLFALNYIHQRVTMDVSADDMKKKDFRECDMEVFRREQFPGEISPLPEEMSTTIAYACNSKMICPRNARAKYKPRISCTQAGGMW